MADLTFGIRITADGQATITETRRVREGLDDIGDGAKRASGALSTMGSVLGALQLDRLISETVSAARESIRFAASLDDLADTTGSTVENLSGLANMAKFSGVSFGAVEQAITQMSRRLSAADDDSKRMGAAMRLLGVEARDPALAFNEIAQKLNQYADGANKVALAQELFGRSGAQLLPLLKDLAEQGEVGVRITTQQAQEAEKLGKEIARLQMEFSGLRDLLLNGVVPAMNEFLRMMREGGTAGLFAWLGITPKDKEDAGRAIEETTAKLASLRETRDTLSKNAFFRLWNAEDIKIADAQIAVLEQRLKALQRRAADFDFGPPVIRPDAPTTGGKAPSRATGGGRTGASEAAREALADMKRQAAAELQASAALKKALEDEEKVLARNTKAYYELLNAEAKSIAQKLDSVAAYEVETDKLGKTETQIIELTLARLNENKAILQRSEVNHGYIEAIDAEIAALERRRKVVQGIDEAKAADATRNAAREAAKAAEQEWQRAAENIGNTITDALMRGFESGKDAARNLRDSLVNMFKTLVLRPIIQAVMAPVAGGIASLLGSGGAAASAGGGAGQWLNLAGSLFGGGGGGGFNLGGLFSGGGESMGMFGGILGGLGTAASAGMLSTFGGMGAAQAGILASQMSGFGMAGTAATLSAAGGVGGMTGAMAGGMGTLLGTLGTVMPWIGFALAIAAALGAFERGGPKTGGSASNIEGFGRFFTPNQGDTEMQAMVSASAQAYEQVLRNLGGTGTAGFAFGFDDDPEGDAQSRISVAARVNGQDVYQINDREVGGDMEDVKKQLEIESKRALLAALQASEMPQQIARVMNSITASSATAAQIDTVVAFGTAMNTALQAAKPGVGEDAAKAYADATQSVSQRLRTMGTELQKLAKEQDGSVGKMQALAAATAQYRQSVAETLIAIKQIGAAVQAMIGQTRESIEFAGLDNQAAYNLARERGNALAAAIAESDDPAEVQRLSERLNAYLMQAFNLLSPEEQLARKPEFLAGLETFDAAVSAALTRIGAGIEEATTDPFAAVNEALDSASVKFEAAANAQQTSASVFGEAVDAFGEHVAKLQNLTIRIDGGGAVGPAYGGGP